MITILLTFNNRINAASGFKQASVWVQGIAISVHENQHLAKMRIEMHEVVLRVEMVLAEAKQWCCDHSFTHIQKVGSYMRIEKWGLF